MSELLPPIVGVLKSDIAHWLSGMKQARDASEKTTGEAEGHFAKLKNDISGHWKAIAGIVGGAISVGAVTDFAKKSINKFQDVSMEVAKMSRLTGESVETMSRLRHAGEETGVSVDSLDNAFKRLSKSTVAATDADKKHFDALDKKNIALRDQAEKLADLKNPTQAQTEQLQSLQAQMQENYDAMAELGGGYAKLGINTTDAAGKQKSMHDILLDVATKFKDMPNGIEKNAMAMKLFGKAGTDLIPLLNKGAEGIAELEAQSDKLGTTIGQKDVDAVKKNVIAKREMHSVIEGLQIQIGRYLYPAVTALTQWFAEHLPQAIEMVRSAFEKMQPYITEAAHIIQGMIEWLGDHKPVLEAIGIVVGTVLVAAMVSYTVSAIAAAAATIAMLAPYIAIIAAIALVAAGVIYAYTHFAWFKTTIDDVAATGKWLWQNVLQPFGAWLSDDFPGKVKIAGRIMVDVLSGGMAEAAIAIYQHWHGIKEFFTGIPGEITDALSSLGEALLYPFKWAFDKIQWLYDHSVGPIIGAMKDVAGLFGGSVDDIRKKAIADATAKAQGRAIGGPVFAGTPYWVGERGPELMVPSGNGTIVPNGFGGGGGRHYTIINQIAPGGDLFAAGTHTVNAIRAFETVNGAGWRDG